MGIQINGNTNNINAGIGSLSIEDINELDIAGVATAANFKTGVSNLHDVGLTLSGGQIDVGSNIKIGTAGVITATSFVGSGANLTSLPAGQLTGTLPAISGANLTNLPTSTPTNITVADESTDTTCFPLYTTAASGNLAPKTGSNLTFNSSSGNLRSTSLFLGTGSNESKAQDGLIMERSNSDGIIHISAGRSGGSYGGFNFYVAGDTGGADSNIKLRHQMIYDGSFKWYDSDGTTERVRITSDGKLTLNYAGTPPSEDVMICTAGQASPARLTLSHLSGGNRYGARLQSISGTNKGLIISELMNSSYSDLAKVNTEFGLKADNTCKTWLCYRSEAGNEGIIDDFNVASVNDEGTGSFAVTLDRNIHRHGNGWSQSIVFGCYNDGSRQLIAGVGYAPSHGSNNPWWDVEDNFVRVNTQRSTDGVKVDAKVFNMAMFGDTGDLNPA